MKQTVTTQLGGKTITIETGRLAKQADGSVVVTCENNIVLVTAVSSRRDSDMDFFPLTVEYQEKYYAVGKFPGGFFKREGRPSAEATLNARLIDRPIRPCFPEGYNKDTQIVATILSSDGNYPIDSLASIGASAACHISDIPFNGPTASLTVGRIDGELVINPMRSQLENSDLEITLAGTRNGILMVEGEAKLISEEDLLKVLKFGHDAMKPVFDMQDELRKLTGDVPTREYDVFKVTEDFRSKADAFLRDKVKSALSKTDKMERYSAYDEAKKDAEATLLEGITDKEEMALKKKELGIVLGDLKYELARSMIIQDKVRIDGRDMKTVRPIACEVGFLPRAHGSGLFTRGETQVLGTITLGTGEDEQIIDQIMGSYKKKFLLHYNFPPYCVGETGRMGGQSRREIGHGNLAERALKAILPDYDDFPYTIRLVGEVFESNGSSSMGTVCSGILAMLDAGIPIKANVAGIAMGLIAEGNDFAVLSDILGDEDHLGDMDFKVAGTKEGISAVQMDIKIDSITFDVIETALHQAKEGRLHILGEMEKVISSPRGEISEFAPRIETIKIKPDKVREVIGPGGKVIKSIIEETEVKIDIQDDGTINIASTDPEKSRRAIQMIEEICAEAEVGKVYSGKVVSIKDFGAFVEILPNTQGLLHISEIAHERVRNVSDFIKEGENIDVKVLDIDKHGKMKLSRKVLLDAPQKES